MSCEYWNESFVNKKAWLDKPHPFGPANPARQAIERIVPSTSDTKLLAVPFSSGWVELKSRLYSPSLVPIQRVLVERETAAVKTCSYS